jgi:PAS domain S-box-containing protein
MGGRNPRALGRDEAHRKLAKRALTVRRATRVLIVAATALASLAVTFAAWRAAVEQSERAERLRFELRVQEISTALRGRMLDYEQVLRGAAALFAVSRKVESVQWATYVRLLDAGLSYPGIQALGYARLEPAGAPARFPVTFIEPLDERTRATMGADMYAEGARRAAMDRARDSAEAALTAPLQLLQDLGGPPRPGFVMYLPVYRTGAAPAGVDARREQLAGFVYATFRASELIESTIGTPPGLGLRLFDVTTREAPALLFEQQTAFDPAARYDLAESLAVRGRAWRLEAAVAPGIDAAGERPRLMLAGGVAISVLLSVLVWSVLNTTAHARELARRMSAALREGERRLALALESSGLALFDWDLRTGVVHLDAQWGAMLGADARPVVTPIQKLEQLVHPDDLPAVREHVRQLLKDRVERYRVEHRVRKARGEWIWIESVAEVSERDATGRALRVTGTNADVTARRAVADLKSALLANVSHELRTPLTGVVASLELLREGAAGELPPEARRFVEIAYANGERLAELISDLLDLERVDSGRLRLDLERIDAAELLREAAEVNGPYAARYQARLRVQAEPGTHVNADRRRVLQVLTNLISNAAKFSPPGGEIRLAVRARGDRVALSVSDDGPGVPEDFKARLFGQFEQAKHGRPGTGLGLAICKSLVERMGGRIWCESEPGKGATFSAELPRAD